MAGETTLNVPLRKEEVLEINMGPQHPSTHGVLRLKVKLNGETVEDVEPILGYLHRSKEKLAEMANYFIWVGTMGLDLGAITPFWWCLREREAILELLEALTGVRMNTNYVRFGGVKFDTPKGWVPQAHTVLEKMEPRIKELEDLLVQN